MSRIRLQIQILPWEDPHSQASATPQARHDEVRPWTQPEPADNTLQDLVDNIAQRYGRIYVGRGALHIKELQDSWGSTLDLTDRVGDIFNDRSSSGDILTSICKVLRYPPAPAEFHNPQRFASLLPESSARPQKRPAPPLFHDAQRPLPTVENWEVGNGDVPVRSATKRRKTRDNRIPSQRPETIPTSQSSTHSFDHAQRFGTQTSNPQVVDSQASFKAFNPYGTPTSLSNPPNQGRQTNPIQTIPDSPIGERVTAGNVDREDTKSESPELRLSVHDVAPLESENHRQGDSPHDAQAPIGHSTGGDNLRGIAPLQPTDDQTNLDGNHEQPAKLTRQTAETSQAHPNKKPHSPTTIWRENTRTPTGRHIGADIFDPIESDTESFQEKQHMINSKRFRLSRTPLEATKPNAVSNGKPVPRRPPFKAPLSIGGPSKDAPEAGELVSPVGSDRSLHRRAARRLTSAASEVSPPAPETEGPVSNDSAGLGLAQHMTSTAKSKPLDGFPNHHGQTASKTVSTAPPFEFDAAQEPVDSPKGSLQSQPDHSESGLLNPALLESTVHGNDKDPEETIAQLINANPVIESSAAAEATTAEVTKSLSLVGDSRPTREAASDLERARKGDPRMHGNDTIHQQISESTAKISNGHKDGAGQPCKGEMLKQAVDPVATRSCQMETMYALDSKKMEVKEQQLTQQAQKMMLAADGEKQLEIERTKVLQGSSKSRANGWIGVTGQAPKVTPLTEARKAASKRREQQLAEAGKFRKRHADDVANSRESGAPSSSQRGPSEVPSSSATHVTNLSDGKRRTLTPLVPGSASSSLLQVPSPLASKLSGGPLQTAIKQPSSRLRRSLSQVSSGALNLSEPKVKGIRNAVTNPPTGKRKQATANSTLKSTKSTRMPAPGERAQSKLKVTRDKKQKSRLVNPPAPTKKKGKEAGSPSEDEDSVSSYISEEDVGFGISKAGPSANKKRSTQSASTTNSGVSAMEPFSSSIDPALKTIDQIVGKPSISTSTKSALSSSVSAAQPKSDKKSSTQTSPDISISSGSSSEFESESESGNQMPPPPLNHHKAIASNNTPLSTAANGESSQSSVTSSSLSSKLSTKASSGPTGIEATKQLYEETQDFLSSSQVNPSRLTQTAAKVRSDALLPNGMKPANYRYPSLSQLTRAVKGKDDEMPAKLVNGSSQQHQRINDIDLDSESDEDDSESDSSQGDVQTTPRKSSSGIIPGIRSILKRIA